MFGEAHPLACPHFKDRSLLRGVALSAPAPFVSRKYGVAMAGQGGYRGGRCHHMAGPVSILLGAYRQGHDRQWNDTLERCVGKRTMLGGLFLLGASAAVAAVILWSIQNDRVGLLEKTRGIFAMKDDYEGNAEDRARRQPRRSGTRPRRRRTHETGTEG
ncbi:MAG: hypothetical protein GVY13_08095 [Alphaproteobacteria bacterium]|jgi:hypothetical protein|nr:hypothetical protein [Alphaproteobacteria bacterium]